MKKRIVLLLCFFGMGTIFLLKYGFSQNRLALFKLENRISNIKKTEVADSNFHAMGWLRVQGTNIDYPILRTDNDRLGFSVEVERTAWSYNHDDKLHNRMYLMGHNIFNLSSKPKKKDDRFLRFESLLSFIYYDFAKENQYIQLTVNDKDYMYRIFAVDFLKPYETYNFTYKDDYSKDEMKDYLKTLDRENIYRYDVDVNENDKLLTLVTCTRFFGARTKDEFFVTGRLMRENEKTYLARVDKSDEYKKIEDIWEGDLKNESSDM